MKPFEHLTAEERALHQLRMHASPGVVVAFGEDAVPVHARAHERGADHRHEGEQQHGGMHTCTREGSPTPRS